MARKQNRVLALSLVLTLTAGLAVAAPDLWLHVKVDEAGGAKVTVNLPLALVEKAMPMLPIDHLDHIRFDHGEVDADLEQIRELWQEVRNSPDMTFVTVEEDDGKVKVWKKEGHVYVEVREADGKEQVDVKVPLEVVDAFLSGDEVDFTAAIQALVEHGQGEFVEIRDDEDHVRVWVDEVAEAE